MDVVLQDLHGSVIRLVYMDESSRDHVFDRSVIVSKRWIGLYFVLGLFSGVVPENVRKYFDSARARSYIPVSTASMATNGLIRNIHLFQELLRLRIDLSFHLLGIAEVAADGGRFKVLETLRV